MTSIKSFSLKTAFHLVACLGATCVFWQSAQGQTTLGIQMKPTVLISGPLGSMQEVQYNTNLASPNGWTALGVVRVGANPTYFTDTDAGDAKRFYRTTTVGLTDTNLVWIPAGTFVMGSPTNEADRASFEGPQTTVTLTHGFFMGRYEVRNVEYSQVVGPTPIDDSQQTNYWNMPVRGVTWALATNYCGLLTLQDAGLGKIPLGWAYRLPTEAEWEYACRASSANVTWLGNTLRADATLGIQAVFNGNYPYPTGTYSPSPIYFYFPQLVGSCQPNGYGLYDMNGNVDEWCLDGYTEAQPLPYPGGSVTNFVSTNAVLNAIVRGGSYTGHGKDCRAAARRVASAYFSAENGAGFRVVLAPVLP